MKMISHYAEPITRSKRILTAACILLVVLALACETEIPTAPEGNTPSGIALLAKLSAAPERVGPGGTAKVTAVVIDGNGNPLAGERLDFSTTGGSITPFDTTDALGVAEAIFIAPRAAGTVQVRASFAAQRDSLILKIDGGISQNLQLSADTSSALADGISKIRFTAVAWSDSGAPIQGARIQLSTTAGQLPSAVVTNENGRAAFAVTAPPSATDIFATITAKFGDLETYAQLQFHGLDFRLEAQPLALIADGRSTATVRAILKETSSYIAVPAAEVQFGTDHGTIPASVSTNESGVAEAYFTSAIETGMATIIASHGPFFSDTVRIAMGESVPAFLAVSASPTVLVANSESQSEIKATVTDASNSPVPDGTPVTFEILSGSGTIESRKTTLAGVAASVLISSNHPDSTRVRAAVAGLADTVLVRFVVGQAAHLSIIADSASLPADGKTSTAVRAYVSDAVGNPVEDGTLISFAADFGDITPTAETRGGIATARFSSSTTGLVRISAALGELSATTTVRLLPGQPNSILLSYDPVSLGVKDSGRNTTLTVTADIRDTKNNPVVDGTLVRFAIIASPGGGEALSTDSPVPTLNGRAQISLNSGIRSGTVRLQAEALDSLARPLVPPVRATSTDVIIFAGPPYIADVNDPSTSRASVGARPMNIYGWHVVNDTTTIVAVVGDKYNNPVPAGTAVYFTTTGGIISTYTGYTDENGVARVRLHSAQPYPTVPRYYNTFFDPNEQHPEFAKSDAVIPGPIPDLENSVIDNGYDQTSQNNGIARVIAVTEGVDAGGNPARVWGVANVIFSGAIATFYANVDQTELLPGEGATIDFYIYDENGNPIVPGSNVSLETGAGKLSWTEITTSDPGTTHYSVMLINNLDPTDPDAKETTVSVGIRVRSSNGNGVISTPSIRLKLR